ncbi:hypothetical protein KAFR_0A08300 [Kazachstania africana CBS 2517]|uniref:FZ domain-containing protein n=1 Tax=Kazachstania africana (strain ATCC 22294 / BCRC 22015 / CBS 2517 / CECT 1963 / NBRC 1671 / NRRL Y-8276) TaxID=1071382 RepID=H2APG4_KAZAF|nr:hypothetical protein KAFR_0A08300 [Kazachstania africana CBS 2517]CCF56264.1 hypothetical protein KAFR_0A08300 [Kazachstania africana CBS 2517]
MLLKPLVTLLLLFVNIVYTLSWNSFGDVNGTTFSPGIKLVDYKRSSIHEDDAPSRSIINSDTITEWTPISSNLTAGSQDYFVFSIDLSQSKISSTYEILIFLSGNICSRPMGNDDIEVNVSYSFNDSIASDPSTGSNSQFDRGYLAALAVSPIQGTTSNSTSEYSYLYVIIELYNSTTGKPLDSNATDVGTWRYSLSISENDLVYQWDSRTWLSVLDTDDSSALLRTGNVSSINSLSQANTNYSIYDPSLYDLYIYSLEDSEKFNGFNLSLCAVKNGPYLVRSVNDSSESSSLTENTLAVQKSINSKSDSISEYFYVTGLNSSTTYVAYLIKKISQQGSLSDVGGVLFTKVSFTTADDDTCSLIYNLDFCPDVSYSVPSSSLIEGNKTLLAETYQKIAQDLYSNFSTALQMIPCQTEEDAAYSPLRTCDDCAEAYRNWLCAVTIPRCSTEESPYFIARNKTANRNVYIDEYIKPLRSYYEILPCIDMCYNIVKNCPSDFGFSCPSSDSYPELLYSSYNFYRNNESYDTCNFLGNYTDLTVYS